MQRPAAMWWNGTKVTDHNRAPINITVEAIERAARMANGTMRKFIVAKKRTFATSWDMLPHSNANAGAMDTVDGGMAGQDIENFYFAQKLPFTLTLRYGDGTTKTHTVFFADYSKEIQKRGSVDFWSINISLVEV